MTIDTKLLVRAIEDIRAGDILGLHHADLTIDRYTMDIASSDYYPIGMAAHSIKKNVQVIFDRSGNTEDIITNNMEGLYYASTIG